MAKQKPSKIFRIGSVSGSIFENVIDGDGGKKTVRSLSLQRSFKDGDEWRYSTSFGIADIPVAIRVLELAQQHIEAAEAEIA